MSQDIITNPISTQQIVELVLKHYGLDVTAKQLPGYIDFNFLLTSSDGMRFILKIANADEPMAELAMQNALMNHLQHSPSERAPNKETTSNCDSFETPLPIKTRQQQDIVTLRDENGQPRFMRLLSFVDGVFFADHSQIGERQYKQLGAMIAQLSKQTASFTHPSANRYLDWDLKQAPHVIDSKIDYLKDDTQRAQIETIRDMLAQQLTPFDEKLPQAVIHNDINDYNLLLDSAEKSANISGLIDFGDMVHSYRVNELAIAITYAMLDTEDPLSVIKTITQSYHEHNPLLPVELWVLFPLICARLATSVCNSAKAILEEPDNDYLLISAKPAWRAIDKLLSFDAKNIGFELQRLCNITPMASNRHDDIIAKRKENLFQTLSISYQQPLIIERGQGQYLLDENDIAYLDMVNNVCHVGHCHPKVVAAGQAQMATLNTNTRYLHQNLVDYSQALLETMPDELSVVMFVNSGSEANELAMRLMQCATGSQELLVVDGAYHGHTNKAIEISPYKFNGPGGEGAADNIHIVPMPDPYRGEIKGMSKESGHQYAQYAVDKINQLSNSGKPLGGFICESLQGVGGNLIMPNGYLKTVYQAVRAAGGICIADEVQVGFGRVGSHWWAFETQDVVPDIVTLGKPIGNGHPLAAVVTTKAIADAFVTGMEYFNTFGGNPVSCAIGHAVLDTIKSENLRENALETGNYFMAQLRELVKTQPLIGDVRGLGLFIGAELVLDEQLTPATEQAKALCEILKRQHILLSLDGPHNNVLKIKPPIVFNRANVDYFVSQLDCALSSLSAQE
ncbi:MAG: aminotransferase class III-fold pyridoxal phosphate-dependent enzyme [Psychrobium sp.]